MTVKEMFERRKEQYREETEPIEPTLEPQSQELEEKSTLLDTRRYDYEYESVKEVSKRIDNNSLKMLDKIMQGLLNKTLTEGIDIKDMGLIIAMIEKATKINSSFRKKEEDEKKPVQLTFPLFGN